jgi:hypothetical protein
MNTTQKIGRLRGRRGFVLALVFATGFGLSACSFLDPTNVENPRTTADDLADTPDPVAALLPGLRAQFARATSAQTVLTEVVTDNYSIHGTGLSKTYDTPRDIGPSSVNSTGTATGLYWNSQELRALSEFVIEDLVPVDETATAEDVAEAFYYRGMAHLLLAENFVGAPVEEDGEPITPDQLLDLAITDFQAAINGGPVIGVAAQAALARAYRWKGDRNASSAAANAALSAAPDMLWIRTFDANSISQQAYFFLVNRALQEMQPLPRLDFLDPKYLDRESAIAIAKAEEMYLILAEINLVGGSLDVGKGHLATAISLANDRVRVEFTDFDQRLNADLSIRPRDASIKIRADASSPFLSGLVLDRPGGTYNQMVFSGTSLDPDSIQGLTSADEVWHAFWLARQEILFLEGRRMADLGIRLPIMLREIDANPNIEMSDPVAQVFVPTYIPQFDEMDLFTPASPYDAGENLITDEVTMMHDMNKILAANNVSPFR